MTATHNRGMHWGHRALLAFATLGIVGLLVLLALLRAGEAPWQNQVVKSRPFQATVVSFADLPNPKWDSDKVFVVASTVDGRRGQGVLAKARRDDLDCKVGDPVSAHMEGAVMVVDALTCNRTLR